MSVTSRPFKPDEPVDDAFAVGSFGYFGSRAKAIISWIAEKQEMLHDGKVAFYKAAIRQKIQFIIQKIQADAILHRGLVAGILDV